MRSFIAGAAGVLALVPQSARGFSPPRTVVQQRHHNICSSPSTSSPLPESYSSLTQLHSVPTSIDTALSGLASIARLPFGVTVVASGGISSVAGPVPKLTKLYDIENDRDCRAVRERITELDLVVERVIPAAENSRAVVANSSIGVPKLVAEVDGKETAFSGVEDILAFFDDKFTAESTPSASAKEDGELALDRIKDQLLDLASYLPGILRAGRGSSVCSAASSTLDPPRPAKPLVLYSYEGNQFCRLVREVLTELDIPYELRSAGKGSPRRDELASITGGSSQCPFLIDPNTGVEMSESKDIVEYLYSKYALWTPPSEVLQSVSGVVTPLLKPVYKLLAPLQAGSYRENEGEYTSDIAEATAEVKDEISSAPVVIYTYELSPFCTEAVALLKSLNINCKEVSLGKEWIPGLIEAPEKRAALLEMTGQSSLPNVFVGGTSVGGLYSGNPGLVPSLERGEFMGLVEEAKESMSNAM